MPKSTTSVIYGELLNAMAKCCLFLSSSCWAARSSESLSKIHFQLCKQTPHWSSGLMGFFVLGLTLKSIYRMRTLPALKSALLFMIINIAIGPNSLEGQCTGPSVACNGAYASVVICEVSGDAAQSDGCNDAIVEVCGASGTAIGCMVISNSEWAVVLPSSAVIPADGVFLIACSSDPNASCGVGGTFGANGLVANGEGDFNVGFAAAEIDFDVCDPANANYFDPAATGFTLDNSNVADGDAVVLFQPDGTVHDAIAWGGPGATGNADNCALHNGSYTLGDNDNNGVINDNLSAASGGRCDGNNATGVPFMPDGDCSASSVCYTMPPLTDAVYTIAPGTTYVGCNSSYIRLDPGTTQGGTHNNPSHADGTYTDQPMDANSNPTAVGIETMESFTAAGYAPSSCGDNSAQWSYTDHPTPGLPNDVPTFTFYVDNAVQCTAGDVEICAEIYNWQHISDATDILSGDDNIQTGSYVFNPLTGVNETWDSYVVSGSVTILCKTVTLTTTGTYEFGAVIDDFSNCCGTQGSPHSMGTPNECYETQAIVITVYEPLAYDCDGDGIADDPNEPCVISCDPGPPTPGTINANDYLVGGGDVQYQLIDLSGTNPTQSISSGVFSIPTDGTANSGYQIDVLDLTDCGFGPLSIMIDDNCELQPVCPENFAVSIDGGVDPITSCPGNVVELCFDGEQLPPGGTITWQVDDGGGYVDVEIFSIPEPDPPNECVYVSELLSNPDGNDCDSEFVTITNSCTNSVNISGWTVWDETSNDVHLFPIGSVLAGGSSITLHFTNGTPMSPPVPVGSIMSNDRSCSAGGTSGVFNQGGDSAILTSSNLDRFTDVVNTLTYSSDPGSGVVTSQSAPPVVGTSGSYNSTPTDKTFCADFTIPSDACPIGNFEFQALVTPFDSENCPDADPDEADATSEVLNVNVSCPSAAIPITPVDVCEGDPSYGMVPVTINGGTGPYTLSYELDGVVFAATSLTSRGTITVSNPTDGELKLSLISILDEGGAMCLGTVADTELCINIRPKVDLTISGSSDPSSCEPCDGTVTFNLSSGTSSNSFDIDYSLNGTLFSVASVSLPYTIENACPGNYDIVSATDDFGCEMTVETSSQTLNVPSGKTISVTTAPAAICGTDMTTVDLSAVTYDPEYSENDFEFFTVDPNTLPSSVLTNSPPLLSSTTVSPLNTTTYWVQHTDPISSCISLTTVTVAVDNSVCCDRPTLMASTINTCPSLSEGSIDLTATGGTGALTYSWSNTATTEDISLLEANIYTVTVTVGGNSACTVEDTFTVLDFTAPTVTGDDVSVCEGEAISLAVTSTGTELEYSWSTMSTNGFTSTQEDPTVTASALATDTGTYTVTVTDENGCTATDDVEVTVNELPTCTTSDATICEGETINLTETGGEADIWSWTGPDTFSSSDQNPTISSASSTQAGTYTVVVTDDNDCTSSCDAVVTVIPRPELSAIGNNPSTCGGDDGSMELTLTDVPDGTYTINYMDVTLAAQTFLVSVSGGMATITGLTAGTYNDLTITVSGCASSGDVDIVLDDPNAPPAPVTTAVSYCLNETAIALTAMGETGAIFIWYTAAVGGTMTTTVTPLTTSAGTTSFFVSQTVASCESERAELVVTVNSLPTCTTSDLTVCEDDAINLAETGGDAVSWSWTGPDTFSSTDQNPTISAATMAQAGTYTVVVTDVNDCTSSCEAVVTVNALPPVNSGTFVQACRATDNSIVPGFNLSDAENIVNGDVDGDGADGSTATVTYYASVGDAMAGNNPLSLTTDLPGDDFYALIEGANGCSEIVLVDLQVFRAPSYTTASTPTTTCGSADGTITISGLTPMAGYMIDYQDLVGTNVNIVFASDADGEYVLTGLVQGTYSMVIVFTEIVTDMRCEGEAFNVVVGSPDPPVISVEDLVICEEATAVPVSHTADCTIHRFNVDFFEEANDAGFMDMTSASELTIAIPDGLMPGTYEGIVTIICENFCTRSEQFSITVEQDPELVLTQSNDGCTDEEITLTATPSGLDNYEFYVDANVDGVVDAGESLQSGSSANYVTTILANGTVVNVLGSNFAAANNCMGEAQLALVREEPCPVYDVALMKTLTGTGPFSVGDMASFEIIVFNQGNLPVYNALVEDYLPQGLDFCAAHNAGNLFMDNPDTPGGRTVMAMVAMIPAGGNVVLTIELKIGTQAQNGTLFNVAEITSATTDPEGMNPIDDEDDDLGETDGGLDNEEDNEVDDETAGGVDDDMDEDDFDFAALVVCNVGCNGTFPWNGQ